jgi:hypothetical protein
VVGVPAVVMSPAVAVTAVGIDRLAVTVRLAADLLPAAVLQPAVESAADF